jgi:plasmid stabilization system protein ParE
MRSPQRRRRWLSCRNVARGTVVKELADRSIREVYVYRYRLIYQVASEQVRVLAVIHGAMDFAGRLKDS